MEKLRVLGFAGSLRIESYNKAILRAAVELTPEDMEIETFDLEDLPFFNQDFENDPPEKLMEFKEKIRAADGILIVTPEYNYSIPGVLKNAIDCASRPYGDNAFNGKPVTFMGGSTGMLGTARAQYHLRQSCVFLNMFPMNLPEIMVPFVDKKIDEHGRLADAVTRQFIADHLRAFSQWIQKLSAVRQ